MSALSPTVGLRHFSGVGPTALRPNMFFLDTFCLDSFPGDPHLLYMMPRGEMGISSPGGVGGIRG